MAKKKKDEQTNFKQALDILRAALATFGVIDFNWESKRDDTAIEVWIYNAANKELKFNYCFDCEFLIKSEPHFICGSIKENIQIYNEEQAKLKAIKDMDNKPVDLSKLEHLTVLSLDTIGGGELKKLADHYISEAINEALIRRKLNMTKDSPVKITIEVSIELLGNKRYQVNGKVKKSLPESLCGSIGIGDETGLYVRKDGGSDDPLQDTIDCDKPEKEEEKEDDQEDQGENAEDLGTLFLEAPKDDSIADAEFTEVHDESFGNTSNVTPIDITGNTDGSVTAKKAGNKKRGTI